MDANGRNGEASTAPPHGHNPSQGRYISAEIMAKLFDFNDPTFFENMIKGLMHNDNSHRRDAEGVLEACKAQTGPFSQQLVQLIRGSKDTSVRSMCAVLLRKVRGLPDCTHCY